MKLTRVKSFDPYDVQLWQGEDAHNSTLRSSDELTRDGAFTLIELILIMAVLVVAISLVTPQLRDFFRGQALSAEARQLLSLTHAGQARAVSDGFPTLLWIDPSQRTYGLQEEGTAQDGTSQDVDPKAEEFALNERLQLDAVDASPVQVNGRSLPAIRFLPDGTVDETSPTKLRLQEQSGDTLWLIQSTNRLGYEIRDSDR